MVGRGIACAPCGPRRGYLERGGKMKDRLCVIIASVLGLSPDEVSDATSSENCPNWDSLQHFALILAVEQEYGVRFSSGRIPTLTRVSAIREEIDQLKAG